MMKIHVLAGDALAADFKEAKIAGEVIVCRECLVEGAVKAEDLAEFWQIRAAFIADSYDAPRGEYFRNVVDEFEKLQTLAASGAEINLWFEYELFCQVNYWFCLFLLRETAAKIYRVAPVVRNEGEIWKGFGNLSAEDLEKCFADRVELSKKDVQLGADLWIAYQTGELKALGTLSEAERAAFPYLSEVCRAEIEKASRPQLVLRGIIAEGKTDLAEIFPEFAAQAGVYGFGDAQVARILRQINRS